MAKKKNAKKPGLVTMAKKKNAKKPGLVTIQRASSEMQSTYDAYQEALLHSNDEEIEETYQQFEDAYDRDIERG